MSNPEEFISTFPEGELSIDPSQEAMSSVANKLRRVCDVAMVGVEVSPLNEAIRFGAIGVALASGADPVVVGAVAGGATLAVESGGAVAVAGLLTSHNGDRAVGWINAKLENNLKISPEAKFSSLTKAGIAFLGGSAIVSAVKYREDPEMTESEVRNYGLKSAIALAGSATVMGYALGEGIELPGPQMVGTGLIATGILTAIWRKITARIRREQVEEGIDIDNINKEETE